MWPETDQGDSVVFGAVLLPVRDILPDDLSVILVIGLSNKVPRLVTFTMTFGMAIGFVQVRSMMKSRSAEVRLGFGRASVDCDREL